MIVSAILIIVPRRFSVWSFFGIGADGSNGFFVGNAECDMIDVNISDVIGPK